MLGSYTCLYQTFCNCYNNKIEMRTNEFLLVLRTAIYNISDKTRNNHTADTNARF